MQTVPLYQTTINPLYFIVENFLNNPGDFDKNEYKNAILSWLSHYSVKKEDSFSDYTKKMFDGIDSQFEEQKITETIDVGPLEIPSWVIAGIGHPIHHFIYKNKYRKVSPIWMFNLITSMSLIVVLFCGIFFIPQAYIFTASLFLSFSITIFTFALIAVYFDLKHFKLNYNYYKTLKAEILKISFMLDSQIEIAFRDNTPQKTAVVLPFKKH